MRRSAHLRPAGCGQDGARSARRQGPYSRGRRVHGRTARRGAPVRRPGGAPGATDDRRSDSQAAPGHGPRRRLRQLPLHEGSARSARRSARGDALGGRLRRAAASDPAWDATLARISETLRRVVPPPRWSAASPSGTPRCCVSAAAAAASSRIAVRCPTATRGIARPPSTISSRSGAKASRTWSSRAPPSGGSSITKGSTSPRRELRPAVEGRRLRGLRPGGLMIGRITVAGSLAQKPYQAGHTWQFLQYLLGFRRLGWDVLFLDTLRSDMRRDLRYVDAVMREFGLEESYSVAVGGGSHPACPRAGAEHLADSDLLINVMGFLHGRGAAGSGRQARLPRHGPGLRADVARARTRRRLQRPRRVRHDRGAHRPPGLRGAHLRPPLGHHAAARGARAVADGHRTLPARAFTSVASWRGAYGPIDYRGRRYGLRVHEFRKFADLPRVSGGAFELALDIHPTRRPTSGCWARRLVARGPGRVARTPDAYRRYVQGSRAELMVAKGMYVGSRSGWFSERSICYLASGRPVLAQDTGLAEALSGRRGPADLQHAGGGRRRRRRDPGEHPRHAAAARGRSPRSISIPTRSSRGWSRRSW